MNFVEPTYCVVRPAAIPTIKSGHGQSKAEPMSAFGTKRRSPQRKINQSQRDQSGDRRPFTAPARRPSRRARPGTGDPRSAL